MNQGGTINNPKRYQKGTKIMELVKKNQDGIKSSQNMEPSKQKEFLLTVKIDNGNGSKK